MSNGTKSNRMNPNNPDDLARRNSRVMIFALIFVCVMVALSFAAVPLYRVFCAATGLEGTTQRSANVPRAIPANTRSIQIRFDASVDSNLPWDFRPAQRTMTLRIGEPGLVHFTARNLSAQATEGIAVHNVTPMKAGKYFVKTQCFCFSNQPLAAHATADLPVTFFVDPKMLKDPNMQDVQEITLSYRFYPTGSKALDQATRKFSD